MSWAPGGAEWWSTIGIVVATLVLIVVPGVIYAYSVLDLWIADPTSYATVMREVEPSEGAIGIRARPHRPGSAVRRRTARGRALAPSRS